MAVEYHLSLREVLSFPQLRGSRVLAGADSLDRAVSGVSLTDLSDYDRWLAPGELLVTTCFSLRDDPAAQRAFLPTLDRLGLSGVCIKPRRFLEEIPDFMVEEAATRSFPLVELPPEAQFREIAWAVFEALRAGAGPLPAIDRPELPAFLRHLLLDPPEDEAVEAERGKSLGFDLSRPLCAARLSVQTGNGVLPSPAQTYFLYRSFLSLLDEAGQPWAAAVDGPELLLVLPLPQGPAAPQARIFRACLDDLSASHPELSFQLGWSRPGQGTSGLRQCCMEARAAIQACGSLSGSVRALCFSQLGLSRLLLAPEVRAEAHRLAADLLGVLPDRPELLATLECYFQCLGNVQKAAQRLHTHYNTTAYRLRQVQSLTGIDLRDPDQRFHLELALRLYYLLLPR